MRIDFTNSAHVLFFAGLLPFLSLSLSWGFYRLFPNSPFWLETISPVFAYILFYSLFDKYLWFLKIFRIFRIVTFPDLRGRWRGIQRTSFNGGDNKEVTVYLEISQTFSKIFARAYYERSQSESVVASFINTNNEIYFFYTYDNDPNSLKVGTMQAHKGTAKLKYLRKEKK